MHAVIRISDEQLEALGKYFVHHQFYERFGYRFDWFLREWENGTWKDWIM
jgi:hypothetical protein